MKKRAQGSNNLPKVIQLVNNEAEIQNFLKCFKVREEMVKKREILKTHWLAVQYFPMSSPNTHFPMAFFVNINHNYNVYYL